MDARGRGGAVERDSYTNCSVSKANYAFMFAENYGGHPKGYDPTATPTLKDVRAVGIRGDANNSVAQLLGLEALPSVSLLIPISPFCHFFKCLIAGNTFAEKRR